MKQLIFLMAMLWMTCPDMAQAQTRRTVRKPTTSASKPVAPKQKDDPEYKRLIHELDSLEALRDDLLKRVDKNTNTSIQTRKGNDGTEYQVSQVILNENTIVIYLRLRNTSHNTMLNFQTLGNGHGFDVIHGSMTLNNGEDRKDIEGKAYLYLEKNQWREFALNTVHSVKVNPIPKMIERLIIREGNTNSSIEFNNLTIIDID